MCGVWLQGVVRGIYNGLQSVVYSVWCVFTRCSEGVVLMFGKNVGCGLQCVGCSLVYGYRM